MSESWDDLKPIDLDTCIHADLYYITEGTITSGIYDEFCVPRCIRPRKRYDITCKHYVPIKDTLRE